MSTPKKKTKSVFCILFVIVLLLLVAATATSNVIFSGDRVPKVAGYYLYLHETEDMEPDIPQNSLVFAKEAAETSLAPGNKVLCYLADGNLALRVIYNMTIDSDNRTSYFPGTALEQGSELSIPRTNIFAICTGASKELYAYVKFSTSVPGLMVCLVVPCIILIVMLLVKIAKSGKDEIDEEDFFFDEEEIKAVTRKPARQKQAPLFNPETPPVAAESLEKKKSSISENFSAKPVNENSPYQKAVQERTMKFKKIQQEDIERVQQEEREKAKQQSTVLSEPETVAKPEPPKPVTPELPAAEKPVEEVKSEPVSSPSENRFSSPNIDDILNAAEYHSTNKSGGKSHSGIASSGSIDDLIAVLENEKKKL